VHDIGKNIVAVVLGCNNYKVVDLGVMCQSSAILEACRYTTNLPYILYCIVLYRLILCCTFLELDNCMWLYVIAHKVHGDCLWGVREHKADIVGLSGLITPLWTRWCQWRGTSSARASRSPPHWGGHDLAHAHRPSGSSPSTPALPSHVLDASRSVPVVSSLLDPVARDDFIAETARPMQSSVRSTTLGWKTGSMCPLQRQGILSSRSIGS